MLFKSLFVSVIILGLSFNDANAVDKIDIPFETFKLDNGLTVIVHEDHKAPIVAVNIWYHVGGKDEPNNRQEFAHLFEHLMFNGTENYNDEWFKPFERIGTTDQNGTTSSDRTNYFQNVPTTALDMTLWLESDRMGHLLGAVDQETLDQQRGVVQNEKRQRENQPYGLMWDRLFTGLYPQGHPYNEPQVPADELLKDAKLDEVKDWFKKYYGAANATLVLAGDIDLKTAKEKAEKYFAHIPSGPPLAHLKKNVPNLISSTRDTLFDRVSQPRIVKAWIAPEFNHPDNELLQLAAQVLGGSAASRLDARLIHKEQIADSSSAFAYTQEVAGAFVLMVDAKANLDPKLVEAAMSEELEKLLRDGPSDTELARAKTTFRAGFVRGIERIGGFGGKADVLAECMVFGGDPGCYRDQLQRIEKANVQDIKTALNRWLTAEHYTLTILPHGNFKNTEKSAVDRSKGMPVVTQFPDLKFPQIQRAKLNNGIQVILAERHEIPTVTVELMFEGGFATDPQDKRGLASFAMGMLDEGTKKRNALEFKSASEDLGAQIWSGAATNSVEIGVSSLTETLEPSLVLMAEMLQSPRLDKKEIERIRKQRLAGIAQEKTQPQGMAMRVLPPLLYGLGHPYSMPFSGSGTEASIAKITHDDIVTYLNQWVRPENASILVVGDTTIDQVVPILNKHLANWKSKGQSSTKATIEKVKLPSATRVFLLDKPGALQSNIIAGVLAPGVEAPNKLEIDTMNNAIGGSFTARLNMNLRENKHWSYGVYSFFGSAKGQRPYMISAPVQADKTADSILEIKRELREFITTKPATKTEIEDNINNDIRALPGQFETANAVLGAIESNLLYNRPDDYIKNLRGKLAAQTAEAIHAAAREVVQAELLTWVIVGDLSKIETSVRALNLGEVKVIDVDGNLIR